MGLDPSYGPVVLYWGGVEDLSLIVCRASCSGRLG